jgi:hypothetical protein
VAEFIRIDYPQGAVALAGFEAHWLAWFVLFLLATMLLLRGRFGVTL